MNAERLLTLEEVAERLSLSPLTVGQAVRRGKLPRVKEGRQWRFREADVDAYIRDLSESQGLGPQVSSGLHMPDDHWRSQLGRLASKVWTRTR